MRICLSSCQSAPVDHLLLVIDFSFVRIDSLQNAHCTRKITFAGRTCGVIARITLDSFATTRGSQWWLPCEVRAGPFRWIQFSIWNHTHEHRTWPFVFQQIRYRLIERHTMVRCDRSNRIGLKRESAPRTKESKLPLLELSLLDRSLVQRASQPVLQDWPFLRRRQYRTPNYSVSWQDPRNPSTMIAGHHVEQDVQPELHLHVLEWHERPFAYHPRWHVWHRRQSEWYRSRWPSTEPYESHRNRSVRGAVFDLTYYYPKEDWNEEISRKSKETRLSSQMWAPTRKRKHASPSVTLPMISKRRSLLSNAANTFASRQCYWETSEKMRVSGQSTSTYFANVMTKPFDTVTTNREPKLQRTKSTTQRHSPMLNNQIRDIECFPDRNRCLTR